MESETLLALAIVVGLTLLAFSIAGIILAVLLYKVAKLYAPDPRQIRRTPEFGAGRIIEDHGMDSPILPGLNRYPKSTEAEGDELSSATDDVAERPIVTQVAVAAEGMIAQHRAEWWAEKREDGYSDDEIGEMEDSAVVPVFEEGS